MKTAEDLLTLKILSIIATPFTDTEAFKYGIIDAQGNNLRPYKTLSDKEKSSYSYLTRFCFNIKKLLNKLPNTDNKMKNTLAGLYLVRESRLDPSLITESNLRALREWLESHNPIEEILMYEEVVANNTGNAAGMTKDDLGVKPKKKPKILTRAVPIFK